MCYCMVFRLDLCFECWWGSLGRFGFGGLGLITLCRLFCWFCIGCCGIACYVVVCGLLVYSWWLCFAGGLGGGCA